MKSRRKNKLNFVKLSFKRSANFVLRTKYEKADEVQVADVDSANLFTTAVECHFFENPAFQKMLKLYKYVKFNSLTYVFRISSASYMIPKMEERKLYAINSVTGNMPFALSWDLDADFGITSSFEALSGSSSTKMLNIANNKNKAVFKYILPTYVKRYTYTSLLANLTGNTSVGGLINIISGNIVNVPKPSAFHGALDPAVTHMPIPVPSSTYMPIVFGLEKTVYANVTFKGFNVIK